MFIYASVHRHLIAFLVVLNRYLCIYSCTHCKNYIIVDLLLWKLNCPFNCSLYYFVCNGHFI